MAMMLFVWNEKDRNKIDQALNCTKVVNHWKVYKPEYVMWCVRYLNIACNIKPNKLGITRGLKKRKKEIEEEISHCKEILKSPARCLACRNHIVENLEHLEYLLQWYTKIIGYIDSKYETVSYLPLNCLNSWESYGGVELRNLTLY